MVMVMDGECIAWDQWVMGWCYSLRQRPSPASDDWSEPTHLSIDVCDDILHWNLLFLNTDYGLLKETGSCGGRPHSGEKGLHVYLHFEICNFDFLIYFILIYLISIYLMKVRRLWKSPMLGTIPLMKSSMRFHDDDDMIHVTMIITYFVLYVLHVATCQNNQNCPNYHLSGWIKRRGRWGGRGTNQVNTTTLHFYKSWFLNSRHRLEWDNDL